jgi:ketosteroid isomerase-like protein
LAIPTVYIRDNAELTEAQVAPIHLDYVENAAYDRVSIVARRRMLPTKGNSYDNIYPWLFTLRGRNICNVKELLDALAVPKTSRYPAPSCERAHRHHRL